MKNRIPLNLTNLISNIMDNKKEFEITIKDVKTEVPSLRLLTGEDFNTLLINYNDGVLDFNDYNDNDVVYFYYGDYAILIKGYKTSSINIFFQNKKAEIKKLNTIALSDFSFYDYFYLVEAFMVFVHLVELQDLDD